MAQNTRSHWDARYAGAKPETLTWFEQEPALSLSLIKAAVPPVAAVIDVGGGASRLPDALLKSGFSDLTVLDLSPHALSLSQDRLGDRAGQVTWIAGDVTAWQPDRRFDLWHDRAVYHFLTDPDDRTAYARTMARALAPGGVAILMGFADDGPEKCSGLPVRRHAPEDLAAEIEGLLPGQVKAELSGRFIHPTLGGAEQRFQYVLFRRLD